MQRDCTATTNCASFKPDCLGLQSDGRGMVSFEGAYNGKDLELVSELLRFSICDSRSSAPDVL